MFYYLDFGKFKSEAKRLKRSLNRAYPHHSIKLNTCQNLIAQSLGFCNFNQLFLAHQKQLREMQSEIHFNLKTTDPKLSSKWIEFSDHLSFRAWVNDRKERLGALVFDTYGESNEGTNGEVLDVLKEVWSHLLENERLPKHLSSQNLHADLFNEKDWRNGLVALNDDESSYIDLLKQCLPKLKKDGGITILTKTQALKFIDAWNAHPDKPKVPVTVFNMECANQNNFKPDNQDPLTPYYHWPFFDGKEEDASLLKFFQFGDRNISTCMSENEGLNMWLGKAFCFLEAYYNTQPENFARCDSPSIEEFVDIAYDENIPLRYRMGVISRLQSINMTLPSRREDVVIKGVDREFYHYQSILLTLSSYSMKNRFEGVSPLSLTDWSKNSRMTIFVVSDKYEEFSKNFIAGMLTVLYCQQIMLAADKNLKAMSKGLFISPFSGNDLYAMKDIPPPLCNNTLWGWVYTPSKKLSNEDANSIFRKRAPRIISG